MVFVIAAEEMPLKAKSADNIIASFLRIFVLKKKITHVIDLLGKKLNIM